MLYEADKFFLGVAIPIPLLGNTVVLETNSGDLEKKSNSANTAVGTS